MRIVKAEVKDIPLLLPQFIAYRAFYNKEEASGKAIAFLSENLEFNRSCIFMAINSDDQVVGFTQLYPRLSSLSMDHYLYLSDLYVDAACRKQGVARALMNKAFEYAITDGASSIQLETAHSNISAQALYESLGYGWDKDYRTYYLKVSSPAFATT